MEVFGGTTCGARHLLRRLALLIRSSCFLPVDPISATLFASPFALYHASMPRASPWRSTPLWLSRFLSLLSMAKFRAGWRMT
eukprot:6172319-Pleurochrysis_carterae.AAC.1